MKLYLARDANYAKELVDRTIIHSDFIWILQNKNSFMIIERARK